MQFHYAWTCVLIVFTCLRHLLDIIRTENVLPGDRIVPKSLLDDVEKKMEAATGTPSFRSAFVQGSSSRNTSVDDMGGLVSCLRCAKSWFNKWEQWGVDLFFFQLESWTLFNANSRAPAIGFLMWLSILPNVSLSSQNHSTLPVAYLVSRSNVCPTSTKVRIGARIVPVILTLCFSSMMPTFRRQFLKNFGKGQRCS